jgi:hypothetical protein
MFGFPLEGRWQLRVPRRLASFPRLAVMPRSGEEAALRSAVWREIQAQRAHGRQHRHLASAGLGAPSTNLEFPQPQIRRPASFGNRYAGCAMH